MATIASRFFEIEESMWTRYRGKSFQKIRFPARPEP
jgi:hypothetical protein